MTAQTEPARRLLTPERVRIYPQLICVVLACLEAYRGVHGHLLGRDFLSFYTAGSFVLHGNIEGLAHTAPQLAFQRLALGLPITQTSVWVSPPYFAWLFAPLAKLPFLWAYALFTAASTWLCAKSLAALRRELGLDLSTGRIAWLALQYYPTLQWLINGQITGLWLSVSIWVFLLLRRDRELPAGLLFGLFACKPTLALGLCVALLAARRFRMLSFAAISASVLLALGFITLPAAMSNYLHSGSALLAMVRHGSYHTFALYGSFEFATLLLDGVSHRLAFGVGVAMVCGLLALLASMWMRVKWMPATKGWDLRMAATLALGVVTSPHLYTYDLTLLLLPLFVVVSQCPAERGLPLGGQGLLRLTAWVWLLGALSPYISLAEQEVTSALFGAPLAVQVGVPLIIAWGLFVARMATHSECEAPVARAQLIMSNQAVVDGS